MKPYYEHAGITIYHGDCREILGCLPVAFCRACRCELGDEAILAIHLAAGHEIEPPVGLVFTDPPYGLNYNDGDLASQRESAFGGNIANQAPRPIAMDGEEEAMQLFRDFLALIQPKLKQGACCCCCCCCCCCGGGPKPLFAKWTLWLDEVIGFKQAVVWDKGGLGMGIHFRRSYEFVLIAQNGDPCHAWNGGKTTSNVWRINKIIPQQEHHPTEKPQELALRVVRLFSHPNDLVVDPFMGSGTTIFAAKQLGRRAFGIDIEERWCELAAKRLSQEVFSFE
jgi:DNA modification methylase